MADMFAFKGYTGYATESHGGKCCGVSHLYSFQSVNTPATIEERVEVIKKAIQFRLNEIVDEDDYCINDFQHCFEAIISEQQHPDWRKALVAAGFKEVFEFFNSNSGNQCYVYMFETGN